MRSPASIKLKLQQMADDGVIERKRFPREAARDQFVFQAARLSQQMHDTKAGDGCTCTARSYYECRYTLLPQCNASASGRAAQCVVNPYFAGAKEPAGYRRHRRVYQSEPDWPPHRLRHACELGVGDRLEVARIAVGPPTLASDQPTLRFSADSFPRLATTS
jgi:hypothetical protein